MLSAVIARIRALFRPEATRREIDEELHSHLERETERHIALGASPQDAKYAARRGFGNPTLHREEARDAYGWRWLDERWQDVRYAAHQIKRAPVEAVVIVLLFATGIGPVASLLSGIETLKSPWPGARQSDRLVWLPMQGRDPISGDEYSAFLRRQSLFEGVARSWGTRVGLSIDERPSEVDAEVVTGQFFSALKLGMALGTGLPTGSDSDDDQHVRAVVSYQFWKSQLGGSRSAVGRTVKVNGIPVTIVGVMPGGFPGVPPNLPTLMMGTIGPSARPELWLPLSSRHALSLDLPDVPKRDLGTLTATLQSMRLFEWNGITARLRDGVTAAQAETASKAIGRAIRPTPDWKHALALDVTPAPPVGRVVGMTFVGMIPLAVIALPLLIITCANASILLLGRAMTSRREIAVRLSIGISRRRLVGQLVTETTLLALCGGAIALVGLPRLNRVLWPDVPGSPIDVALGWNVAAGTIAFTLVTGALVGLGPALRATRIMASEALKDGAVGLDVRRGRLLRGLVVVEAALCAILVCWTATLVLTRALPDLHGSGASSDVLLADLDLRGAHYTAARADSLFDRARDRIGMMAGVRNVGFASGLPPNFLSPESPGGWALGDMTPPDGHTALAAQREYYQAFTINLVDPGHFDALQHPLSLGRDLAPGDTARAPLVAIVSGDLAAVFWPGASPIGHMMTVSKLTTMGWSPDLDPPPRVDTIRAMVVGVTGPMQLRNRPFRENTVYLARRQWPDSGPVTIVVTTQHADAHLRLAIERELRTLDAGLPLTPVVSAVERQQRSGNGLQAEVPNDILAGVLALLLACIGIYAVIALGVAQRSREIGIRIALGARTGQVVGMLFRDGMLPSVEGFTIGVLLAFRILTFPLPSAAYFTKDVIGPRTVADLVGVRVPSPLAIAAIIAVLLIAAAIACWLPARRAATVDPLAALQSE
jgi:predicted permease